MKATATGIVAAGSIAAVAYYNGGDIANRLFNIDEATRN